MFDWPFRILLGFLRGFSEVFDWLIASLCGSSKRPLWQTVVMLPVLIPYWFGWTIYTVLSYPFSLSHLDPERRVNLYWGTPALVVMVLTFATAAYTLASSKIIDGRYQSAMLRAIDAKDFRLASILGGRLVSGRDSDPKTRFSWAIALLQSGEVSKAEAVLADLAPSDHPGYAPAHRLRARYYADQLQQNSSDTILEQLRWHLENSGDEPNVAVERFWTAYYVKVGQPEEALPHMEQAAKLEPRLLITLANLYQVTNNKLGESRTLRAAEAQFIKKLKSNPLARVDRLQLLMAQTKLKKLAEAEETILMGVQLHNDDAIRRSAAEFYVLLHQVSVEENPESLALQFSFLEKALAQDPFYPDIYEKMILFYQRTKTSEEANKIQNILETMLVDGKSPALVHFTLSSIFQIQGNPVRAESHLFQSYRLDGKFPLVTNNLAWMLAHRKEPDLPRAHELALNAVQAMPKDPRFRDTLATVLMLQGKSYDAIAEFEAIISLAFDKISVHRKLGDLYRKIGDIRLSEMHEIKADDLTRLDLAKTKK